MDFNQMLQDFVNKEYSELVSVSKTAIDADGTLTEKESALIRKLID